MGWLDEFKERSQINGTTQTEISKSRLQDTFDEYFATTPDKITDGQIDGVSVDFVIQHIKYGEDISDIKLLIAEKTTTIYTGSIIDFDSKKWIAINEENRAIDTHKVFKIQLCNNTISWKDEDENTYSEYCTYTSVITREDTNKKIPRVDNTILIGVQNNANTSAIELNDRFIFSNKWAYYVTMIDDMDIQDSNGHNMIYFTMLRDIVRDSDDLNNNIADRYINNTSDAPTDGVSFDINEMNIKIGMSTIANVYEYVGGVQQATTFTFRIDGIDSSKYTIDSTTGNSITITCDDYPYSGYLVAIRDGDLAETQIVMNLNGIL